MRLLRTLFVSLVLLTGAVACGGDGEDRPGQVTSEGETGSVSGSASGSASGTGSASASASGTGSASASGSASGHGHGAHADFTESDADTVVDVTFDDYAFVGLPQTVKGPHVFFKATNNGEEEHELAIEMDGEVLYELEPIAPGAEGTLAAELEPGTYRIVCHVETEDGKTHEELGMVAQLTVE